jgi:2-keto-4-pentenoate hydratase
MALSELQIDSAALLLLASLRAVRPRPALPRECAPANLADAYAIQERFVSRLGRPAGYKIGYASEVVQRAFGISEPVFGRLLADRVLPSPGVLPSAGFTTRVVETEFGVRMGRALPARAEAYSLDEVTGAVAAVMPSFEIVDSRFEEWKKLTALLAVADNVLHSHWVAGPERTPAGLDLAAISVVTRVNGREATRGTGAAVLGSPYRALHWLANALVQRGRGLAAGEWVTTGCCTEVLELAPGDVAEADFGPLGSVRVEFPV